MRTRGDVLGSKIDVVSWPDAVAHVIDWAKTRESRYVCACNVHVVVTATSDHRLANAIEGADLATPDGMPIAWSLRRAGFRDQKRISGPDLMLKVCEYAAREGISVFLFGSLDSTLAALKKRLLALFDGLQIVGTHAPPFREPTDAESRDVVASINQSGAGIVFVGLGCPKQELWMARHRGQVDAVMLGVGAAFDYHAGTLQRAPRWMRQAGLEWLFRLAAEPGRLWHRYLVTNTFFLAAITTQLIRAKK